MKNLTTTAKVIIGIGVASAILIIGLVIFGGGSNDQNSTSSATEYRKDDPNRPIAILAQTKIDWGNINLKDTKESDIDLKNDGNSTLEITKLSTSCGCTGVKVSYNGTDTKEYSMHQDLKDKISIAPKTSAKLKVIYRPFTMPVEGAVTRQVFIETNDPNNAKLEIDASAVVNK
ncbi:MAG: DUF1573 domain-containing protein [Patescibacteria group bacterium]|nr:DUF1573 domain-containing protein [Patescibacteria group bacterium]